MMSDRHVAIINDRKWPMGSKTRRLLIRYCNLDKHLNKNVVVNFALSIWNIQK